MTSPPAPNTSRPLDTIGIVTVLLLCLSWGFNQVSIKLAIVEIPPLIQCTVRSIGASLIVAAWMKLRGQPVFARDGALVPGIICGLMFGAEFLLIYRGLLWTTAGRASLFLNLAPFFVVIGSRWFLPKETFSAIQWIGLLISFAGVAVAFGLPTPAADPRQMIGDLMMLVAAVIWGATTIVIKASALSRVPPAKVLLYQLIGSIPLLALGMLAFGERMTAMPSASALGALAYQTVWVVSITFAVWFALIMRYSASRLSVFTFLTPLFGIAAGHFALGEPLTPAFAAAAALVAIGLILVNRPR